MPNGGANNDDRLQWDYEQTYKYFGLLADTRFKLMGVVAGLTGLALKTMVQCPQFSVSLFGLVATIGLVIYDFRNSQLYDAAKHRLEFLERFLHLQHCLAAQHGRTSDRYAGIISDRHALRDWGLWCCRVFPLKHDFALGIIYGASLAAWVYLAVASLAYGVTALLCAIAYFFGHLVFALCFDRDTEGMPPHGAVPRHEGFDDPRNWWVRR